MNFMTQIQIVVMIVDVDEFIIVHKQNDSFRIFENNNLISIPYMIFQFFKASNFSDNFKTFTVTKDQ